MKDENSTEEKILIVGGEEFTPEKEEERKQQLAAAKAKLDDMLKRGEIDGVEYNNRIIELQVPTKYKAKHRLSRKQRIGSLIVLALVLLLIAIPTAIQLNWRFYFQNTLVAKNLPSIDQTEKSSIENAPIQVIIEQSSESGEYKGRPISVSYIAYYDIAGVVTSVHDYWGLDDYATLVPRDVCIAWGSLGELWLNHEVSFYQVDRFCHGKVTESELDPAEVFTFKTPFGQTRTSVSSMSNNHLIPSTPEIRNQIFGLNAGDKVRITGYLVNAIYGELGLKSSMTREDVGNGACEVIYVTGVENLEQKH